MTFWNSPNIHPKTKSRFVVVIGSYMIPTVVTVSKPKISVESKEFRMINHYYKYPGLVKWSPITITFVDGTGETWEKDARGGWKKMKNHNLSASDLLAVMLAKSGYMTPDKDGPLLDSNGDAYVNKSGITTPEKASMMALSFGTTEGSAPVMKIQQLDSGMIENRGKAVINVTEQWELFNPIITEIDWGSLAYGDEGLVEYSMTIDYDYAKMTTANIGSKQTAASLGQYDSNIFEGSWKK